MNFKKCDEMILSKIENKNHEIITVLQSSPPRKKTNKET